MDIHEVETAELLKYGTYEGLVDLFKDIERY